jgi:hypothetical protein
LIQERRGIELYRRLLALAEGRSVSLEELARQMIRNENWTSPRSRRCCASGATPARLAEQGTRLDLRVGIETYLDAGLDPEFQRIVLVDAPAILGSTAWNALVDERGIGFLRTWLQRAIDERQIDPMP